MSEGCGVAKGAWLRMFPGHCIPDHYVNNLSSTMRLVNSVSLGKQAVFEEREMAPAVSEFDCGFKMLLRSSRRVSWL